MKVFKSSYPTESASWIICPILQVKKKQNINKVNKFS